MYRRYSSRAKLFLYDTVIYLALAELSRHAPFGNQSELPVAAESADLFTFFIPTFENIIVLPLRNFYGRIYSHLSNKDLFLDSGLNVINIFQVYDCLFIKE